MITAASNAGDPQLFGQLHSELIKRLAQKAVIEGDRSLELVQAILVMESWLWVPDNFENVNFYQWIHIAATMALQLGLGGTGKGQSRSRREESEATADMQELRTTLVVYLSASSVAISLRRDNMFGLTPAVRVALDAFSKRAETTNDRRLLAWIRLEMIAEDVQSVTPNQQYSRESFLAMSSDVAANVYRLHIRLENWQKELQPGIMNELLFVHFQYCKAKLYEVPVHFHHDLSKLVAYPFTGGDDSAPDDETHGGDSNAILRRAVQPYHDACRGVLHAVLAITPEALGGCPTVLLARAVYAMNGLKVGQRRHGIEEDVRSIHTLIANHLSKAVGEHGRQIPRVFLHVWKGLLDAQETADSTPYATDSEHLNSTAPKAEDAYSTP
ncbi:uncharacterized protein CLAFUR5_14574 [Fulvia fulva]|uniref:Uncharacterized protein n=1 Tax=Passalora fulva TaxID=5499 RepID=A0A9Q8PMH4_PASFU|nr:uncharacterized protein CLAFUR5_14574 [Fulvia fulva]UJO25260.1 hypothetical protein CLAFUR5_14574 [Fulvia fulva]